MTYSLNEIDSQVKKAARGAGFTWGHAEEIGKTVRWLTAYRLPGTRVACRFLDQHDKGALLSGPPELSALPDCRARFNDALCPVVTAAYLSDVTIFETEIDYTFKRLGFPLLLLPTLARLAERANLRVCYRYQSNHFMYAGGKLSVDAASDIIADRTGQAVCRFDTGTVKAHTAALGGQPVAAADWTQLANLAQRTYVPASEQSRRGAGPTE